MLISDYQPTKRIGVDELDGTINMLARRTQDAYDNGESCAPIYEGAWLALSALRMFRFEYPRDFMNTLAGMIERGENAEN